MRETSIFWPEDTLGCPLRASYAGQADDQFSVAEVVDGPPRFRLATSDERRTWTVGFLWSWQQVQIFEGFVASDLNMGLLWFRMDQLTGDGMSEHFCHLIGDYVVRRANGSATHFDVTFAVEAFLNAHPVPPPFEWGDDIDAGEIDGDIPTDVIDARTAEDPRPPDRIDALVPGA